MLPERVPARRGATSHARIRSAFAAFGALAAVTCSTSSHAAEPPSREPLVFVGDPRMGTESSVRTIDSIGRMAYRYEDVLSRIRVNERSPWGKVFRFVGRGLELLFLDEPIAELTALAVHEVGGHGARGRELGLRPTYVFYLPGVYRPIFSAKTGDSVSGATTFHTDSLIEEPREIVATLGGLEANYVHAWWINARIARAGGWVHHGDLLTYAVTKVTYAPSFFSSDLAERGGVSMNDVESYVTSLQEFSNGFRSEDRRRIARRLGAAYVWNLADPMLLYALYGTLVSSLVRGERWSRAPLPEIRGVSILPSPRFGLTPFGAEHALDVFLANREGTMLDLYARVGVSGLASYYGAGARVLGVRFGDRLTLGGELDVWRQPEILLGERGLFARPSRGGINAGAFGDVRLTKELSLTGKLAGKTSGYVAGLPIGGGPHGYLGMSVAWP